MGDKDDADHNDQRRSPHHFPVDMAIIEQMIKARQQDHTGGDRKKGDRQQQCDDLAHRFIEPVKIAP
jgi:hypothetical protein